MSEFKGTKGDWIININDTGHITSVRSIEAGRTIFTSKVNNMIESNANMNLAMHAPEMLEMLKDILETIRECETPRLYEIEELIKKATE